MTNVIDKIKKILALANAAGTKAESLAASAHAARLMNEYHVSEAELGDEIKVEEIVNGKAGRYPFKPWTRIIFKAVMKAFRVRAYTEAQDRYNRSVFNFYGEATDVAAASLVFTQAIEAAKNLAVDAVGDPKKNGEWHKYFSYLDGFAEGLAQALEQQGEESEALMVVSRVPERVNQAYIPFARAKGLTPQAISTFKTQAGSYTSGKADGNQFAASTKGVRTDTHKGTRLLGA